MCNMKVLSLLIRKLWPRLKFFKSRSDFKVKVTRSKIMVPCERFPKVGQTSRSRSQGQKLWNHVKGLVTRNTHMQYEFKLYHFW